jgi:hypothetical protein
VQQLPGDSVIHPYSAVEIEQSQTYIKRVRAQWKSLWDCSDLVNVDLLLVAATLAILVKLNIVVNALMAISNDVG